jgi:predicted O-linked N-acetylglucosamine transferase (SPINDLY family)
MDAVEVMERAMQLFGGGDVTGAEACCRQALGIETDQPDALYLLGVIEHARRNEFEAERLLLRAIDVESGAFWYHAALAEVRVALGNAAGAIDSLNRAIDLEKGRPELYDALGQILSKLARPLEAAAAYEAAITLDPKRAPAHAGLVAALLDAGRFDDADRAADRARQLVPDDAQTHYATALVLIQSHDHDAACDALRRALERDPALIEPRRRLAWLLAPMGDLDGAVEQWNEIARRLPLDGNCRHNLLMVMNYRPEFSTQQVFEAHRDWGLSFADHYLRDSQPHANSADPERRLRVGYVSSDFYRHPVSTFALPLLLHHHKDRVEAICFAHSKRVDDVTRQLRAASDGWHDIMGMNDLQVAQLVREQHIDVLVDLASHSNPVTVPIFARRPAPVQISYIGYCTTTGMSMMDYVVGDDITDPPDDTQPYVEQLLRLPGCFTCYSPRAQAAEPNGLPALSRPYVTLGSFLSLQKLNDRVLDVWSRVLGELPGAKLLILREQLSPRAQAHFGERFAARGIEADRLILRQTIGESELVRHAYFHEADVALDAFPWSGHTTACHSMWMGVPFVTLRGRSHAARMAASVVTYAGFEQFVANGEDEYVRIVQDLAADLPRLAELRRTMRAAVARSRLCDGPAFIVDWETALREAWRRWCAAQRRERP